MAKDGADAVISTWERTEELLTKWTTVSESSGSIAPSCGFQEDCSLTTLVQSLFLIPSHSFPDTDWENKDYNNDKQSTSIWPPVMQACWEENKKNSFLLVQQWFVKMVLDPFRMDLIHSFYFKWSFINLGLVFLEEWGKRDSILIGTS